jgi:3-hydroxyacyl-[acyl-carrier-protein] dehydratase
MNLTSMDVIYFMSESNKLINTEEIMSLLPHRYPFILIDKVTNLEIGKNITAIKNVTINENFFQGHFPSKPIMPGVLIIESMAQAAGVLGIKTMQSINPEAKDFMVYFMSIEEAKFRKFVTPGDTLIHKIEVIKQRSKMFKLSCISYVENEVVAEAVISAMLEIN